MGAGKGGASKDGGSTGYLIEHVCWWAARALDSPQVLTTSSKKYAT